MIPLILSLGVLSIVLETLLLVHLVRLRLVRHYPYFSTYLGLVWLYSLAAWIAYHFGLPSYLWVYWIGELVTVFAGFFVVAEILRHLFRPFDSVRRLLEPLLLLAIGGGLALLALLGITQNLQLDHYVLYLERWGRLIQACLLTSVVAVARYYSLPLGRNTSGLLLGYGLHVSLTLVHFALQGLGLLDLNQLAIVYQISYIAILALWCWALWSYAPNPHPPRAEYLMRDYARLQAGLASISWQVRASFRRVLGG